MPLIGLIGGVSTESTHIYYRLLSDMARQQFGGQHSAEVLLYALDYGVMVDHYGNEDWDAFKQQVVKAAKALQAGGVKAIAITSGTTHVAADAVKEATNLPVIHMLDSLSVALTEKHVKRPLLLGTPWVMSNPFFATELTKRYAGEIVVADNHDQHTVGQIIFTELVDGVVTKESRQTMADLVQRYADKGADGVILGCTELCMILDQDDCNIPVLSTTHIHAEAIHNWSLAT